MPMGDSAGRSAGNRTAEGARRRNTQRERALVEPPWDEQEATREAARSIWLACILVLTVIALMVLAGLVSLF